MGGEQNEKKVKGYLKIAIRVFLGAVFIVSAISKMLTINSFEIFIFSFGIFSLNLSFILARLVISTEIFLGFMLITGWKQKITISLSLLLLAVFTVFLIYLIQSSKADHCHCFGDIIKMSNPASIIKNICFAFLLWLSTPSREINLKRRSLYIYILLFLSLGIPLSITPPAFFVSNWYAKRINYDEQLFNDLMTKNPELASGKKVVSFLGTNCKYCVMAAQKLSVIANKSGKTEQFVYLFYGTENEVENFFNEAGTPDIKGTVLDPDTFLKITNGRMPLILLVDNGVIADKFSFAIIDDKTIASFLM